MVVRSIRMAQLAAFSAMLATDQTTRELSPRHLQLLAILCQQDHPISVGQLAILAPLSPSATSRAVRRLGEFKLIDRIDVAEDWRIVNVTATPAGHALDARVLAFLGTDINPAALTSNAA